MPNKIKVLSTPPPGYFNVEVHDRVYTLPNHMRLKVEELLKKAGLAKLDREGSLS